ncbi:heat shock protein Hsp 12.2 [Trichuris trichiura]|uniref:Heat shock protein Hsp 12.2 n=1 Tax=Trichuris trichiura TaxID=36087 RepID=A0A077ZDE4_TRITR|nr:heat shock protein Hsp 12.2 [Trichuris trichiura]
MTQLCTGEETVFWHWPWNQGGLAKCEFFEDKFRVVLSCANSKENKTMEIKSSERKNSLTVGLCPATDEWRNIWEVTVQAMHTLHLIVIELKQEMRDRSPAFRKTRIIRKAYRLPLVYDIDTLNATYSRDEAAVIVEARRRSI